MSFGVVFGLAAALCLGVAGFFACGAMRTFRTLFSLQIIATAALLAVAMLLGLFHLTHLHLGLTLATVLLSLVTLGEAALIYRVFAIGTLAIGTLAIVAPIAASYAVVTALLACIFLRGRLSLWQQIGIRTIFLGIARVSI